MGKGKMKAMVYTEYGAPEVLQLKEVDKPVPGNHDLLIAVKATAVNSGDCRLRRADPFVARFIFGLFKPKATILGVVFSGEIVEVGNEVTLFKEGDEVFGLTDMRMGAYAEYLCLPETGALALKPNNMTNEEAAVIPFGGHTALHFLKQANIQKGQKVMVYGASGAVGTAAVQLAKYYGAEVTGVCSTVNVEMVKSLGADKVLDYTKEDITQNRDQFDVIFETVNKISISKINKLLKKTGILILGSAMLAEALQGLWISLTSNKKVLMGEAKATAEDMAFIKKLVEDGQFKPVIDRTYSLEQIAEAHTYAEKGHKKGNVAIVVAEK